MEGTARRPLRTKPTVVGEGKVVAVVPGSRQIVIDHTEIPGFMGAMTMGYKVDSPSLLEGLAAEDRIRFTIDTAKQAIIKVEKLPK
jgi:Cu/Ag efflux protein CusF